MSTLPENNQKKINTPFLVPQCAFKCVCVWRADRDRAISPDFLGWFVSIPAVRYKPSEMVPVSEVVLYLRKNTFVAFIKSQTHKNIQKHHSSHTEDGQSLLKWIPLFIFTRCSLTIFLLVIKLLLGEIYIKGDYERSTDIVVVKIW